MTSLLLLTFNFPPDLFSRESIFSQILNNILQMQMQMLSQSHFHSLNRGNFFRLSGFNSQRIFSDSLAFPYSGINSFPISHGIKLPSLRMGSNCVLPNQTQIADLVFEDSEIDKFAAVSNKIADAAGEVIRKYFRKSFDILDKEDLSPVTIADQAAEESMVKIIQENFPSHAIYGEEKGWRFLEETAEYVWVLDPIDGTKSFITGKPVFGTLIALLYKGKPILGIIDQPVLRERWIGLSGRRTTLNGQEISTRNCSSISKAYMYTTSPHLFEGDAEIAFARVRSKVKVPLYGCDCYAYALLASGFVDLVIESGLKPYDFLSLVPVIEGAGGTITDWKGQQFNWKASAGSPAISFNVVAAGDKQVHQQALDTLQWH
ncbi:bifunctional phosphatase IMPL2, chloroplastic [Solanum dulcamara]|uniref:bifunctional phosphatase IMPL2, chloroplastic n=1 Tax=Solanum dulcamara TaxID=45834 RepID=UPI0024855FC3|nr:bifunctional phosphatase IMPL2, chloroplastic [Solanum dulcamara]